MKPSLLLFALLTSFGAANLVQAQPQTWTPVEWNLYPEEEAGEDEGNAQDETGEESEVGGPRGSRKGNPIETDRPDFTEASSLVPPGRIQLESGYTFFLDNNDGVRVMQHAFPEWLLRVGLTERFELRLGWFYLVENERDQTGARSTLEGGVDLYLGTKVQITLQHGWWPEWACNIQGTVPTGVRAFNAERVNAGFNQLYGWDVTERLGIGASTGLNTGIEHVVEGLALPHPDIQDATIEVPFGHRDNHLIFHQSITVNYAFTDKFTGYTEWFAFAPLQSERNVPQHYLDGGFTYKITDDFQLDIRAGVGLNHEATDFFSGVGYSVRY